MRLAAVLLLSGCAVGAESAPGADPEAPVQPPRYRSALALGWPLPGDAGATNTLSVSGATPGAALTLAYGLSAGATAVPGCPSLTLDIAADGVVDTATADGSGAALFSSFVGAAAAGRTVHFQAVDAGACLVSGALSWTFPFVDGSTCHGAPAPADRVRKVVVGKPYDAMGAQADTWEVWELDTAGTLTPTAQAFTMGRSTLGTMAFTPDGEIGIAVQDDGTLGVLRFDGELVTVVHARFSGSFYASGVAIAPDGRTVWVADGNWPGSGGGLHELSLACDGTLTDLGRRLAARGAEAVLLDPTDPDLLVLPATEVPGALPAQEAHLLDLATPARLDSALVFDDPWAFVAGVAWVGSDVLIGDNSFFSAAPNRVAALSTAGGVLTPVAMLNDIEDPVAIGASPYGDAALVASGFGDALVLLDRSTGTWIERGAIATTGGSPQLPGGIAVIGRGSLRGLAIVAEVSALRRVQLEPGAVAIDLGPTSTGAGVENIVGMIGVQP